MPSVLTNYRGLQVVEGATADGGQALTSNFKWIADRISPIQISTPWNTILGGDSTSIISGPFTTFGFIGPGESNIISNGTYEANYNVITGGFVNRIGSDTTNVNCNGCFIGTGSDNLIITPYIDLGGGEGQHTDETNGHHLIGTGMSNTIIGKLNSCIISGTNNLIKGSGSTVIFGSWNKIFSLSGDNLIGGQENQIGTDSSDCYTRYSTILNGWRNRVIVRDIPGGGGHGMVLNGTLNDVIGFNDYATIVNGYINRIIGFNNYAIIANGCMNAVSNGTDSAVCAVIINGVNNRIGADTAVAAANYVFIGNGTNNQISNTYRGGPPLQFNADYTTIINGMNNHINGITTYSFMGSGKDNLINSRSGNATYCTIINGSNNQISTDSSSTVVQGALIAGFSNSIRTQWTTDINVASSICGGYLNKIYGNCSYSFIGSGESNEINYSGDNCIIGGGRSNRIFGTVHVSELSGFNSALSIIVGGLSNAIGSMGMLANLSYSIIVGGDNNKIFQDQSATQSYYSTIVGGRSNIINGTSPASFMGAGQFNLINPGASTAQSAVIVGGANNQIGGSNIAADFAQILGGYYGIADHYGQFTQASGRFSTAGDAQTSILLARTQTTNATATELYLDGASLRLSLLDQDAHAFRIVVVGRGVSGTNDEMAAAYELTGLIKRAGGTTSIVGSVTKTIIAEDIAGWDANVTAQSHYLEIKATGDATTTVRWVARIELVEING